MKKLIRVPIAGLVLMALVGALMVFGCAPKAIRPPIGPLDTPGHHVFTGLKLLDKQQLDQAQREFRLAIELDPKYSPAHYGMGLALGHEEDLKPAFEAMSRAKKHSKGKQEKAMAYVGFMRLYTLQKDKGWLKDAEKNFNKAVHTLKDMPETHFYMGIAFKEAYHFGEADREFRKVLAINEKLISEADEELKLVQKIERAMPGTEVGKKLALEEKTTRADCAAIFIHELRLDRIYAKEKKADVDLGAIPFDIRGHPLRTDIETIIRIGLRGLEVFPDGSFHPDEFITRAEYAMIIEDIIGTITHDKDLSVKHIGRSSPFPDVRSDVPYFNAIIVCTTRGIMEADNILTGRFRPEGHITGADALLVIRKLREGLRIF